MTDQFGDLLDRLERAAMAYERLGKLTRDDVQTRTIRKAAIAELAAARTAILGHAADLKAALAKTVELAKAAMLAEGEWSPIEEAPKDRPILAWCDHDADPWSENEGKTLTLYAAHAEGMSHAPTGFHIVEWGGAFDDSTWEFPNQASLPDWWFVAGSEFEVAANPTHFRPLPAPPVSPEAREDALERLAKVEAGVA